VGLVEASGQLSLAPPGLEPVGLAAAPVVRARARAERLPPDPAAHPAALYLARLGPGFRKAQALALERIARIASAGRTGAVDLDWTALGYAECQAIRAEIAARYAPATANRHLAALRGVRRECFRLGLISAEALARSADLAGVRGERLPAGRHVGSLEPLALFQSCAADPRAASRARDAALIAVLAGATLRRAEASALNLADADLGEGSLRVRGKGGREHRAFLAQGGEEAVSAWIEIRGSEPGPLFVGVAKGGAVDPARGRLGPDAILAVLRRRSRRAGVADFSATTCGAPSSVRPSRQAPTWRRCSSWPGTAASSPPPATIAVRRRRAGRRRGWCGFPTSLAADPDRDPLQNLRGTGVHP
jgi:integrase